MASSGNQFIKTVTVDDEEVNVFGCYNSDTPENGYDFYDLDIDGECINLGEPIDQEPTEATIRPFVELYHALK